MTQAAADKEIEAMDAIGRTLSFVRRHADDFRAFIAARQAFEAERAAELDKMQRDDVS
ncbi:hypothetical protein A6302_02476 [Methylobrevis pamukkalensis]|uniref:Uncharacterized protein n=2 Tax=Methylobrevis pamukkalensis TaxID=1439726 RepID=A0A1E3H1M5_9HYPH|nr:hypothetical protein A6302_02476 [Methylobrevis pamukkalensis]